MRGGRCIRSSRLGRRCATVGRCGRIRPSRVCPRRRGAMPAPMRMRGGRPVASVSWGRWPRVTAPGARSPSPHTPAFVTKPLTLVCQRRNQRVDHCVQLRDGHAGQLRVAEKSPSGPRAARRRSRRRLLMLPRSRGPAGFHRGGACSSSHRGNGASSMAAHRRAGAGSPRAAGPTCRPATRSAIVGGQLTSISRSTAATHARHSH